MLTNQLVQQVQSKYLDTSVPQDQVLGDLIILLCEIALRLPERLEDGPS